MKLSALTLSAAVATITTASTIVVAAFTSPSNLVFERMTTTTSATSSLRRQAVRGEDVREGKWHDHAPLASFDRHGRVGSSPGHFETHGIPTTRRVVSCHGPPLASFDRHGRVGASPGSFETHGSRSAADGRAYVIVGDTVRETRTSYAPFDHRDGRVGTIGEIGTEGNNDDDDKIGNGSKRPSYIPASGYYIQPNVADEFVPHSSSYSYASSSSNNIASGGSGRSSSSYSSTPAKKKAGYGLGGWKK